VPQGFVLSSLKVALSGTNSSKISLSVGSLASKARLAQRMPQPIALGSGKLGLARDYQQTKKND